MTVARSVDIAGDPGLEPTGLVGASGPYVGTAPAPIARFSREPRLDRLLLELHRAFGPQTWWPAQTPFEVVVGAVLTQNTSWTGASRAIERLRDERRLTPARILRLDPDVLGELVRPSGTYRVKAERLHAVSRWYLDVGGLRALRERELEPLRDELLEVPGVGPETADDVLCYAAGRPTPVVDAYARRVLSRHGLAAADEPYEDLRAWLRATLEGSQLVIEEFHALVVRAAKDHCKNRRADCDACPATAPDPLPLPER